MILFPLMWQHKQMSCELKLNIKKLVSAERAGGGYIHCNMHKLTVFKVIYVLKDLRNQICLPSVS